MPEPPTLSPATPPSAWGDYQPDRPLGPTTFLVRGPAGRPLVLKRVDDDCMLGRQLHPGVRDRLARVRELAHPGVATLTGVERLDGLAYLVWQYLPDPTFDEAVDAMTDPADLIGVARAAARAVEWLHALGVVHGRLHGRNVLVAAPDQVRLTHVSPLLYDDVRTDAADLRSMFAAALARRGWGDDPAAAPLARAAAEAGDLAAFRARLDAPPPPPPPGPEPASATDRRARRRSLWAAAAVAAAGLALAAAAARVAHHAPSAVVPDDADHRRD